MLHHDMDPMGVYLIVFVYILIYTLEVQDQNNTLYPEWSLEYPF